MLLPPGASLVCVLPAQVRTFLQPPLKGVVMETFGSGNGPTKPDLLQELQMAAEQGLIIVNCTHCLQGAVTSDYASGMVGVEDGLGKRECVWVLFPFAAEVPEPASFSGLSDPPTGHGRSWHCLRL